MSAIKPGWLVSRSHPLFEALQLLPGAGVALPDDGDDVNLVVQPPHELNIDRLASRR